RQARGLKDSAATLDPQVAELQKQVVEELEALTRQQSELGSAQVSVAELSKQVQGAVSGVSECQKATAALAERLDKLGAGQAGKTSEVSGSIASAMGSWAADASQVEKPPASSSEPPAALASLKSASSKEKPKVSGSITSAMGSWAAADGIQVRQPGAVKVESDDEESYGGEDFDDSVEEVSISAGAMPTEPVTATPTEPVTASAMK
ncbi:unnamed protein product, partial [Polarella glacialis]